MADKKQDNPDQKGLKGVKGKLAAAFGTGDGKPSVPAIFGQELKRPLKYMDDFEIVGIGGLLVIGCVMTAASGGGIGNGLYWETEPVLDAAISTAADAPYAYAAVTLGGQSYLLVKDQPEFRIFKRDRNDNRFEYIGQPGEAMVILGQINQQLTGIVNYVGEGRSLSNYTTIPAMIQIGGLSVAVEEGQSDIYRYYDAITDKPRMQGLSYSDDLEQFSRMWQQAQETIRTNGYGFTAEGRAAIAERGTEDEFVANGAIIGGLIPLAGMLGFMGIGTASRTRRRVKSFRERGHDDYSISRR